VGEVPDWLSAGQAVAAARAAMQRSSHGELMRHPALMDPATALLSVSASAPSSGFNSCALHQARLQPCAPPDACAPMAAR